MRHEDTTTLDVQGMTCASCVRHVHAALAELAGVTAVDVRLREGTAVVHHDAAAAAVPQLVAALAAAGYPSRPRAEAASLPQDQA